MLNKTLNVTHSMKIFSNADDTRSKVTQLQTTISRRHNITQFEKISSKSPDVSYHGEILHTSPNVTYLELVGTRPYTLYPDKKTSTRTDIAYSEVTRKNTVGTNSEERAKNKDSSTTDKEMTNTHGMTSRNGPHFSLSENTSQIPDFTHTENSAYKWTYNLSRKTSKKSHSSNSAETVKAISTATDIPDFEETIIKHTDVPKEKSSRPDVPLLKETTRHSQVTPRISGYITQSERGSNKTPQITNLGVSVNINPGSTYSAGTRRSPDLIYLEKTSEKPLTTQSEDTSRHLDLTKQDDKSTSKTDSTLLQETSKHIDSLQAKEIESRPANVTGKYIVTSREITGSKRSEDMHLEGITNAPSTRLDVTYSENTVSKMTDLAHSGGRTSKSLDRFFSVGTTFKRPNVVKETSAWTKHANITNFQKTTKMPNLTQFQITSEMHDDAHSEETSRNNEDVTTVLVSTKSEAKFLVQPTTNRTNSTFADETSNAEEGTYLAGTSRPVATYSGETITESTDVPNLSSRPNVTLLGDIRSMQHDTQLRDTSREQQAAQLQITRVKSKDGTQSGITSNKTSRLPNTDVSLSANPMTTFSAWTTGRRLNVTFSEETSARSENVKNAEISLSMKSDGIYSRDITSQVPDFTYSDNTMSKSQDVTYSEKRISSRQDNLSSEGTTLKGQDITGTEQASEMKDVTNLEEVSKIPKVIQLQESASVRKDATQPEGSTRNQATTSEIMSTFTGITLLSSEDITYSDKKSKSPEVTHSKETINYSEGARHARANSDKAHQSVHNTLIKYTPSEYSNIAISEASTRPGTTNIEKTTTKGLHTTQLGETTTRMPQITQLQTASKRQNVTQSESTSSKSPHFTDLIASKSTWQDIIHSKVTIRRVTEATAITTKSDETTSNGQEAEYLEEASTISGETSNIPLSERIYVTNSTVTISSYGIFSEERRKTQEDTHPKGITHNKPNVTQSEETINGPSNVSLSKTSTITLPNVMYSVGAINKRQNVTYTNQASSQPTVTHLTGNTRRNNETNLGLADSPAMTSNPLKFVTSHESHISIHFTTLIPRLFSKETQPSITDSVITSNKMSASSSVHTEKSTSTTSYVNKTTSLPTLASIEKDFTSSVDSSGSSTFKVVSDLHPSTAIHTAFQTSKPLHTLSVSPMKQSSLSNYISIPVYPSETSNVSYEILTTPQHSSTYNEISTKTWTEAHISVSTTAEDTVSTVSTHNTIYPNDNSSSYGIPPRSTTLNSAPVSSTSGRAVPLFAYGDSAGDITYVLRRIDFNSPLFQPVMGFPFGNQLRSFLYYTDNGQIIFPLSKSSIFSYPNPPANGFTADYNVATIAVFWDDADFSKNVGTTYYKEYIKCSSGNESFITEVEEMISRYMNTSYTAQWTLKITWDKVLAYPAKDDDSQTNTYQAVLTTDGFVSYILMLYKDGGMNWDVSNHLTEVVIGYSSGISNNFFKNDDIMRRPAYEKYRPSNYVGYNSDMTGLWLYTLNSNAVNNSRMKCLDWYATQPSASQWNASLLSCPCLYQQGCADFRYRTTKAVLAQSPAVRMLRPTFPSNFGAGIRCLYNLKNNFLEGFQERTWTFAPVVPDEEVLSQEWCCNEVDDPQFCEMYREKRPSVNCWDYTPLSSGWMFGDSHITTLDGLNYTFNGFGDFMLLNASDTGISVILQGRTIQTGTAMATNFQAFVVQYISNTTNVKVEWYLSKGVINTYINGHAVNFSYSADINAKINNSNPGVFLLNDGSITATFEGLLSVSVSAYAKILNAIVILPSQFLNKTMGLLGVWNWYMSDDLMRPDGSYISIKSREEDIFNYGKSWEVTQDSLFTINQSRPIPSNFTPVFFNELISTNMGKYLDVSSACANNKECIYDALSSGSETIGLQALKMFTDFQSLNITLNLMPPKIIGASNIRAFLMESVQKLYKAHGAGTTFTAYTSMHLNVTETGLVTWAPSSPHDFTFQLEAIDSYNVSSFFFIKFIVCSCRVSSECDYKQITRINSSSLYVANCNCIDNYTGIFCQQHINPCTQGCYNNVSCDPLKGCGPCPAGLSGDGLHCSDFDECSQTPCSPNAVCTNTLKGYNCTCKQGFTGNGTHCEDRNKCLTNPCSPNATCTNTKSGYLCSCNKGFLGDGLHCDDVNECLNNPCSSNAYCSNTLGSFVCSCNAGYTGNGYKCTISCGPCDPDYCGNGQPCRRDGSTCAQKCSCHPMFSDDRCLEAGNTYIPEAAENTPQRTLHLRMSSRVNLTAEEANHTVAEFMRWLPVNRFVNISHFRI
ncbi:hypothetical protein GDO78_001662 [Eleutherodactylus coqui]|uniref:Mucin-4 n=1 Tax=Eleutherodactylus coqui TaxID=57060 RepID=A0A8J6FSM8_ELECQ|nr:hypothetical protein GDO78_001662 [Eleutherodactylus coqui]